MKKTYIEAQYRIDDVVFNTGYICIDSSYTTGIFTLDIVNILIDNGKILLFLSEHDSESNKYFKPVLFVGNYIIDHLNPFDSYILESDTDNTLTLDLIRKITDSNTISKIETEFKIASNIAKTS